MAHGTQGRGLNSSPLWQPNTGSGAKLSTFHLQGAHGVTVTDLRPKAFFPILQLLPNSTHNHL